MLYEQGSASNRLASVLNCSTRRNPVGRAESSHAPPAVGAIEICAEKPRLSKEDRTRRYSLRTPPKRLRLAETSSKRVLSSDGATSGVYCNSAKETSLIARASVCSSYWINVALGHSALTTPRRIPRRTSAVWEVEK